MLKFELAQLTLRYHSDMHNKENCYLLYMSNFLFSTENVSKTLEQKFFLCTFTAFYFLEVLNQV